MRVHIEAVVVLSYLPPYVLKQSLSLHPELADSTTLAALEAQKLSSPVSAFPAGISGLGQVLYYLNHLPVPVLTWAVYCDGWTSNTKPSQQEG